MIVTMIYKAIKLAIVFLYGSTGEILIEKSGHLNLGIPGIMCIGGVGGCIGANLAYSLFGGNGFLIVLFTVLFAMIFAGFMGAIYGLFTITMRCNQNVTGLTITTFGTGVLGFWGTIMGSKGITFTKVSTYITAGMFGDVGNGPLATIFLSHGPLVYLGILIAIVTAIVIKKTRTGLSLVAVGENPAAADAAGIKVEKYKYVACIIGAAIAGVGGAFYLLECTRGSLEYVIDALGWLAVALVIFSLWRPSLAIVGSLVFGFLYIMPNYISGVTTAQKELIKIIPYAVTAIVLIVISFFNKKETQPPTALGLSYFREDR